MSDYLPHLYDPTRLQIAASYLRHEHRKIFPGIKSTERWKEIDFQFDSLAHRLQREDLLRDFWNYFHGVAMGWKLKQGLLEWVTSLNVDWRRRTVSLTEIRFRGMGDFPAEGVSETAAQASHWLHEVADYRILPSLRENDERIREATAERSHFPLILLLKDGLYEAADGNGRLLRSIIAKDEEAVAYVAEQVGDPLYCEHWIPTSTMMDIMNWHRQSGATDLYAPVLAEMVRLSAAGRYELACRATNKKNPADSALLVAVQELVPELATYA